MLPELAILLIAVVGVALVAYVLACTMNGCYEPIILAWAFLAPLGNAVLAYPHERSIITLHRVVILSLLVLIPLLPPLARGKLNRQLVFLAVAWSFFVLGALLSLIKVTPGQQLYATRIAIDSFILPPLLGWIVYRSFRVRQHLSWLHLVFCLVSIYLAFIGGLEIYTGKALMPQAGNPDVLYAGEGLFEIVRPTGPYANPAVLSLVGMINLFLIIFCRRAMGAVPLRNVLLHWPGIGASVIVSFMTLTRGIVVAFALIVLIETWRSRNVKQRSLRIFGAVALFSLVCCAIALLPRPVAQERMSESNFWGRVAQQLQTLEVFRDHPLMGVGLCNFGTAAQLTPRYEIAVRGIDPVDAPHNFFGEILTDTGLVGAVPFTISQILLFGVFRRVRKLHHGVGGVSWTYFLMIFSAYWILNMDFGIGYYPELNLWIVFALAILYRYAIERPAELVPVPQPYRYQLKLSPALRACQP